tara:strand:+ start:715 stop:1782 length:1068 start_codon:yes stop_codon:yes gene_type:complete
MTTLIIPCAGKSSRYPGNRPKWLYTHPDGKLMIEKSITPFIQNKRIKNKIITITKDIEKKFNVKFLIKQMFGKKVKILVLNNQTKSASETVFKTIDYFNLNGQILVKDSDSFFSFDKKFNYLNKNFVAGVDISEHPEVSNIHQKSFLRLNNKNQIIDIEEKKIISDKICIGLYSFSSANEFIVHYKNCSKNIRNKEIYLSFIVKSMINENNLFLYTEGSSYEDYGTFTDWLQVRRKYRTFFVDLDGVVFKNKGKYGKNNWDTKNEIIKKNVTTLLKLNYQGAQIVFVSARPEKRQQKIKSELQKIGFFNFKILMGLNHSQRIIINDYFVTNPNPSALAINIARDDENLDQLVQSL